jgi:hypothetical protein
VFILFFIVVVAAAAAGSSWVEPGVDAVARRNHKLLLLDMECQQVDVQDAQQLIDSKHPVAELCRAMLRALVQQPLDPPVHYAAYVHALVQAADNMRDSTSLTLAPARINLATKQGHGRLHACGRAHEHSIGVFKLRPEG